MEVTQFIIPLFVAFEIIIILALYRFVLRDWIIEKWEQKMDEEGWLVIRLEPVINEIEDRMHEKLQAFQDSFFGSVGAMTKKAQSIDPMNKIRKAAANNDWTSLMVEYAANKAGLGGVLGNIKPEIPQKESSSTQIKGVKGLK